ncbi:MAG: hypothetical protein H5T98_01205 [Syntrophomonadaceae bacterium]|jgi:predicted transcriptional regulator|nr:hypothetical protein [Syntrophomonadaceae bacterium]
MSENEIIISILTEIKKKQIPKWIEYKISFHQYGDIIDRMMDNELIEGARVERAGRGNKAVMVFLEGARITPKGLELLKNS